MRLRERFGLKPVDAWWVVAVIDPIAIVFLSVAERVRWLTGNHLSYVAIALTVPTALAFGTGQLALGALLFQVRFLFDCMDGKLARMRGQASRLGWYLDHGTAFPLTLIIVIALAAGMLSSGRVPNWTVAYFVFAATLSQYALFASERPGKHLVASAPLFYRFNPRPTGPDFELASMTVAPVLVALSNHYAWQVFVLGATGQLLLALHLLRKQALEMLGGE